MNREELKRIAANATQALSQVAGLGSHEIKLALHHHQAHERRHKRHGDILSSPTLRNKLRSFGIRAEEDMAAALVTLQVSSVLRIIQSLEQEGMTATVDELFSILSEYGMERVEARLAYRDLLREGAIEEKGASRRVSEVIGAAA